MLHLHLTCLNPNQLDPCPVGFGYLALENPEERDRGPGVYQGRGQRMRADTTATWFAAFFFAAAMINLLSTSLRSLDWILPSMPGLWIGSLMSVV
jgi:hypothetical protein